MFDHEKCIEVMLLAFVYDGLLELSFQGLIYLIVLGFFLLANQQYFHGELLIVEVYQ